MNKFFCPLYDHQLFLDAALMNAVQNKIESGSLPNIRISVCEDPVELRVKVFGEVELRLLKMVSNY